MRDGAGLVPLPRLAELENTRFPRSHSGFRLIEFLSMQTKLSETEGVRLLREEFAKAGLSIREGAPFDLDGTVVSLDGYDPERRVGFEFVTDEAGDRKSFDEGVVAALERKMVKGEAFLLLVDEWDVADAAELSLAARRFLDELRARGVLP